MIKLEHVVLTSPEQMDFIIQGLRNPMNSWEKTDSGNGCDSGFCSGPCAFVSQWCDNTPRYVLGENDHSLMQRLVNAGTDHRKFMRMLPVYVRITAPLYWWKEFDTYKVGTVANSCSTMHKIQEKEFTLEDFSTDHLLGGPLRNLEYDIRVLNDCRDLYLEWGGLSDEEREHINSKIHDKKDIWWQMIQLLPSSYNQTRNVMMNYEVLTNIYKSRKGHKLDEWRDFCKWIEELPYSELIIGFKEYDSIEYAKEHPELVEKIQRAAKGE